MQSLFENEKDRNTERKIPTYLPLISRKNSLPEARYNHCLRTRKTERQRDRDIEGKRLTNLALISRKNSLPEWRYNLCLKRVREKEN